MVRKVGIGSGEVGRGTAGVVWRRFVLARHFKVCRGMAGKVGLGKSRFGKVRHGKAWQVRRDKVGLGWVR